MTINNYDEYVRNEPMSNKEVFIKIDGGNLLWHDTESFIKSCLSLVPEKLRTYEEFINYDSAKKIILNSSSYMSEPQISYSNINNFCEKYRIGIRPPRYGRACVIYSDPINISIDSEMDCSSDFKVLLDLKGVGVPHHTYPKKTFSKSGFLHLPFAVQEIVSQKIIERVFSFLGVDVEGVPAYGLICFDSNEQLYPWKGFDANVSLPVAVISRGSHLRQKNNIELPNYGSDFHKVHIAIEMILRSCGISSSTAQTRLDILGEKKSPKVIFGPTEVTGKKRELVINYLEKYNVMPPVSFDAINIQTTRDFCINPLKVRLVDFGQYVFSNDMCDPILSLVNDRVMNLGGIIFPEDKLWPIFSHKTLLNFSKLKARKIPSSISSWLKIDKETFLGGTLIFGFEITKKYMDGFISCEDFHNSINEFVCSAFQDEN